MTSERSERVIPSERSESRDPPACARGILPLAFGTRDSVRDDRKIALSRCATAPVREKNRSVASRAKLRVVNAIVLESPRAKQIDREPRDVDMRLVVAAIDVRLIELRRYFLTDFEAAGANRRAEIRARVVRAK